MIEIQNNKPKSKCAKHVGNPPNTNQIIFIIKDKQPMFPADSLTVEPNGHKHKSPSFIVCTPKGIPMIVIIRAMEPAKYPMAHSRPPNINHIKFPKFHTQIIFLNLCLLYISNTNIDNSIQIQLLSLAFLIEINRQHGTLHAYRPIYQRITSTKKHFTSPYC